MRIRIVTYLAVISSILILFTSCSTNTQLASSFGKRKYMKGYYFNLPSNNKAIVASNQTSFTVKSELAKTDQNGLNTALAGQAKAQAGTNTLAPKSKQRITEKNAKNAVPVTRIGNSLASTSAKQVEEKAGRIVNTPGITEYHHGGSGSGGGGGDSSLNWAAITGIILAFFFPILGLVFSIIGLNSEYHSLAVAGIIISAVIILLTIIILAAVLSATAAMV